MQLSISSRPRKFSDVFGQPNIVKGLQKRAISGEWPNAILLKGITGIGKSTLAQIIAMTINCKSKVQGNPCCSCSSCMSIIEERFDRNTKRLDGGSSSKDDVIDFAAMASISPQMDKNNIFIIEEADQLSIKAKNALLKILEQPREKVYFILLSMVNTGIPEALQNRCQVYKLQPFSISDTMFSLKSILEKNKLWGVPTIPTEFYLQGLSEIASQAHGSLRLAVQYLDKCLNDELYTVESIQKNLGVISETTVYDTLVDLVNFRSSFFEKIDTLDIPDFFALSYHILTSAIKYVITREVDNEYYLDQTITIAKSPHLSNILKVYDDISTQVVVKKSFFISKIAQLYVETRKK